MSPQHVIKRDLKLSSSTADKRVKNRLYYENNDKDSEHYISYSFIKVNLR